MSSFNNNSLFAKYVEEGDKFYLLKEYAKALTFYNQALHIEPENPSLLTKIAVNYMAMGELKIAEVILDGALFIDQFNLGALSSRGVCRFQLGLYKKAKEDLLLLQKLDTKSPMASKTALLLLDIEEKIIEADERFWNGH